MARKLLDNTKVTFSIAPVVSTASANGTAVDTLGYNDGMLIVTAGVIDTASGNETYAYSVEESDDGSTGWVAVSGATGSITASSTTALIRVKELNLARKRYLRAVLTAGGTTPSIAQTAIFLLGEAFAGAVNND